MRSAWIVVASLLAVLFAASPALAGEVSVDGGILRITSSSEPVDADALQEGSDFSVYDYAYTLEVGDGCTLDVPELPIVGPPPTSDGERTITCKGVTSAVEVETSAGGNFIYLFSSLPKRLVSGQGSDTLIGDGSGDVTATGGEGSDYLGGGNGTDSLDGGAGNDELVGRGGADTLTGADGNDELRGDNVAECCHEEEGGGLPPEAPAPAASPDVIDGGDGDDRITGADPSDRLTGGEGDDTLSVTSPKAGLKLGDGGFDVENLTVVGGDATVTGDARANRITTDDGKDTVDPGAGADKVDTGGGEDSIAVRDGVADVVSCGEGADRVVADAVDEIESSCETIDRGTGPVSNGTPVAPPVAAPALVIATDLKVTARRKGRRITLRGRLVLPAGAAPSLCAGGGVTVEVKGIGRKTVRKATVLDARCAFTIKLKGKASKRLRIKSRFAGTPGLAPFASSSR